MKLQDCKLQLTASSIHLEGDAVSLYLPLFQLVAVYTEVFGWKPGLSVSLTAQITTSSLTSACVCSCGGGATKSSLWVKSDC